MSGLVHRILSLHGGPAYALLFLLPALEASAFIGFLFPGEIAVLLGGVLAFQHRVSLGWAIAAAILGAIIGDSVGYAVGARYGHRLLKTRLLRRLVTEERSASATAFLHRHGGKAVFFGRFAAAFRVLVPGFAGMAQMPYGKFLLYNVLGGVVWATGFVLLGWFAGDGYRQVESAAGTGGFFLFAIIVVVAIIAFGIRYARRHPDRTQALGERFRRNRVLAPIGRVVGALLGFVRARFRPGSALGLSLTAGLIIFAAAGTAFGTLLRFVARNREFSTIDNSVLSFMVHHTGLGLTKAMKVASSLGSGVAAAVVTLLAAGIFWWWSRSLRPGIHLAFAAASTYVLDSGVKHLVGRARPPGPHLVASMGSSFPSGHVAETVVLYGTLAMLLAASTRKWTLRVTYWGVTVFIVVAVALSRIYLRVHYLTDVLGAAALGAAWLAFTATTFRALSIPAVRRSRKARHGDPESSTSSIDS